MGSPARTWRRRHARFIIVAGGSIPRIRKGDDMQRRTWMKTAGALTLLGACPMRARAGASWHRALYAADGAPRLAIAPPDLPLVGVYDERIDPARCLVSEKYDGVRACWDGRVLRHRSGREVHAPASFIGRLPSEPLDGELWFGRSRFDALSAVVRAERPDEAAWRQVRYMVFEMPQAEGSFAERAAAIERLAARQIDSPVRAVAQSRIADRAALRRRLAEVVVLGGEGLVLHDAAAPYVTGRSDVLTKLKPFLDAEAMVVGYRRGRGKYAQDAGALEVETPEGRRFRLGSGLPDALRREPPALGSQVTYRYHDLTSSGLPRFATFLRVHEAL
jgi:DNA ligase-1